MVRETRHLWVGNLPDNIREDRIREHFKRYGRVQNVKLLGRTENASAGASTGPNTNASGATINAGCGICATVAFMDIKSASKAHNAEHVLDERTLTTEYYEPAAIPSAAGAPSAGSSPAGSGYSGSSSSVNSTPAATSAPRYHLSGGEDSTSTACAIATAAAPANWRGTNDSATEYCRRGNTPASYGRYQRNNSTAPYATTPPSNVERTTPHHRWYGTGERAGGATGGESTPSTPGAPEGRRRRHSGSGSSRSESSSPEPSDTSRASTPATQPHHHHHANHRATNNHHHQWAATASGRPLAICVRNLPTRSTDSSLKDGLYHEYKKHGKVVWVKVVGQNADRYAVVRFKKPSDVEKALEVSQDKLFFGCKISVAPHQSCDEDADTAKPYETDIDEYHPKATKTLFIGNLEKDVTQQQLRDKFKHFGRIIEIDIKKGSGGGAGYAFCQFASISSVVEAIRVMDGEYVGGSRVKLGFGKPVATTCVWVDGLTEHTEKQVLAAVSRCGTATSVCVDRAAGAALVHFEQAAAAGAAVRELRRVAALASAMEPDHPRLCVDYASRECQDAFYEQLEKHGGSAALSGSERLGIDMTGRYLPPARHESLRYDSCGARSRASSYGRGSSRTPRYSSLEHYDPADYAADRRYRVYEEVGSSPPAEEPPYEERLQSVVVSPHRARKHRRDSTPDERKHSKERHRGSGPRRSRSGSRRHRRRREGSGGTPLRDEPDTLTAPTEPRRPPRDRPPLPMSLPLPKFAAQLLRTAPPTPRPAPAPAPAPASPPRPPSASSSSGGSAPHSPSLEERIRSLNEKYEKWSGSRAAADALDRTRLRHRLLDVDINEVKPSEVVRSLLAKRSVFDEDSERLEGAVRVPSPGGSPRPRSSPSTPRSLRYPFPTHPPAPTDPRLERPDRPYKPELLTKLNELDYGIEPRVRLRTPSTDKAQQDISERRRSPPPEREQLDVEREVRKGIECGDTSRPATDGDSKSDTDIRDDSERRRNKEINNALDLDYQILENSKRRIDDIHESIDKALLPNKSIDVFEELVSIKSVDHSPTIGFDGCMNLYSQKTHLSQEPGKVTPLIQKRKNSVDEFSIKCEYNIKSELNMPEDIKPKLENEYDLYSSKFDLKTENEKCKDLFIQDHIKKELAEFEAQQNHLNVSEFEILEAIHNNKLETENMPFVKSSEKEKHANNIHLPLENKASDSEKCNEDKTKSDRDKEQHCKDRLERDRHEHEKDKVKNVKNEKLLEKNDKDKKSREDNSIEKICTNKGDKVKVEKDSDKLHKDKNESEKSTKHIEDNKSSRHDHHRREKLERDKRKDSVEFDSVSKSKKDDKSKHDRPKKDNNDPKRDSKKDTECVKSRKSSRDETSRDLCRKDSTDSTTSRTSHDSSKHKDFDIGDNKEEPKPRNKNANELVTKHKTEKESSPKNINCNLDSKLEDTMKIKEKDILDEYNKCKNDNNPDHISKSKDNIEKQRHYSLDSPTVDSKRKERLNSCSSLPSNIGHKRRMSSQDSFDSLTDDIKKFRNESKLPERRDSKDNRSLDRHKTAKFNKGHFAKIIESKTKDDKKNQVKSPDFPFAEWRDDSRDQKHPDKAKSSKKSPKGEFEDSKSNANSDTQTEGLHKDIDFLATLELRSSEEDERQKALRKEMKEKKRIQQLQQIQELQLKQDAMQQQAELSKLKDDKKLKTTDERKKETAREKRMSTDRKSRDEKMDNNKRRNRKHMQSTDTSDSDEPKKHSIFDIVDDGPTYISMYDKVKARSCKNMQKQEEEKRQEKIKAKFSQLKQSRAKREEKKRSSWDEDSDSDNDRRKSQKNSVGSSSDDEQIVLHNKKREKTHRPSIDYDRSKSNDYYSNASNEEDSRNKLSRKNSRTRIMSDTSDEEVSKRSISKSPNFLTEIKKEIISDSESLQIIGDGIPGKETNCDKVKKNSLLNLFGKSDSDDSKLKSSLEIDDFKTNFIKSTAIDFSSESESITSNRHSEELRKKHKKKQKKHKFSFSDEDSKVESNELILENDLKHKHSEKSRRHSNKKEKRKDKIRDSVDTDDTREDKIRSKKNKKTVNTSFEGIAEITLNNIKKEGKMEDIFGPLSDESDRESRGLKNNNVDFSSHDYDAPYSVVNDQRNIMATSDDVKSKEKDENKRKKEKRRKDKRYVVKEEENSLDVDAVSKAIEARLFADSITDDDNHIKAESLTESTQHGQTDLKFLGNISVTENANITDIHNIEKLKKECREKKKKKKKNREDRQNRKDHHHFHHHDKFEKLEHFRESVVEHTFSLSQKALLLDIPLPKDAPITGFIENSDDSKLPSESSSLPRLTDSPPGTIQTSEEIVIKNDSTYTPDRITVDDNVEDDFMKSNEIEMKDIPMPPPIDNIVQDISSVPLPKEPVPNKSDRIVHTFVADVDISENAVRSISNLEKDTDNTKEKVDNHTCKVDEKLGEKPRAVISQEETEDAVAALLGESFGEKDNTFDTCYEESQTNTTHQIEIESSAAGNENIPEEDAEEMRQAVQNLNASEMEIKPDTPVSDNDLLLIDTDTEETEEISQEAIEKLPVNVIPTNQSLNVSCEQQKSEISNIGSNIVVSSPKRTVVHVPISEESKTTIKSNENDVKFTLTKRENFQQTTSTGTPVITSWTLTNRKSIEPHIVNIQKSPLPVRDNENKPTHITANIVQIKSPQSQNLSLTTSPRPIFTPNRVSAPTYQVVNQIIRPQITNMQPPTIKIPDPHIMYQKPQGIVISPRTSTDSRLQSPKANPQGEGVTSPRLANMTILNTSPPVINSVGIPSPNTLQQRSPGQVTVVRMQQPPLSPIQAMHIPPGARAMVSPSRPNSVLVQTQTAPIHFNRLPVTPVLAPISKQMTSNAIVQQGKGIGVNTSPLMHQQKVITAADFRKSDPRIITDNMNDNSKIILSPTNLQHSTNPTVMAQNRLISMQNASMLGNKMLINNMSQLNDKRDQTSKSEQHNHIPFASSPIIHVAGTNHSKASIIQSGSKPVMCTLQDAGPLSRSQSSNVIHTLNSQRLLTPISNVIQLDKSKAPPSVLSMATIRQPTVLTKLESSKSVAITTSSLTNVVMTPVLLKTSNTPGAIRISTTKNENDYVENKPVSLQNHLERDKEDKLDVKINSTKVPTIVYDSIDKQKDQSTKPTASLVEDVAKCETDFEELLKDNTNEIKLTNDPEKKLEVNVGNIVTLFSANTRDRKQSIDSLTREILEKDIPISEEPIQEVVTSESTENKLLSGPEEHETNKNQSIYNHLCETDIDTKVNEGNNTMNKTASEITLGLSLDSNEIHETSFSNILSDQSESSDSQMKNIDENDSWSAKDVNIESVIKKVDVLCSDIPDIKEETTEETNNSNEEMNKSNATSSNSDNSTVVTNPVKTYSQSEISIENLKPQSDNIIETSSIEEPSSEKMAPVSKRGGRNARGRKSEKNLDRIQTRQISKPTRGAGGTKRGRGRAKVDKKVKSTMNSNISNIPGDVYDFHEDSGDEDSTSQNKTETRPRLILTIKSPLSGNSNAIATSTLSISQKDLPKVTEKTIKEDKLEDFVSPSPNTRKSRRLQEKDVQRSTVDDVIEDVVKGTASTKARETKKRSTRQIGVKTTATDKPGADKLSADTRKSPRGVKRTRDRSLSTASVDSSDERMASKVEETFKDSKVPKLAEPPVLKVEADLPAVLKPVPVPSNQPLATPILLTSPAPTPTPTPAPTPTPTPTPIMKPPKKMISEIAKLGGAFEATPLRGISSSNAVEGQADRAPAEADKQVPAPRVPEPGDLGASAGEAFTRRLVDNVPGNMMPVGATEATDARVQSPALPHLPPAPHRPADRATPILIRGGESEGAAGAAGAAPGAGGAARSARVHAGTASLPRGAHHPPPPQGKPQPVPLQHHPGAASRVTITSIPTLSPQGPMPLGDGMYFSHQHYHVYQHHFRATQHESRTTPSPFTRALEAEGSEAPTPPLELRRPPSARVPRPAHSPSPADRHIMYAVGCGRSPPPAHGTSRLPAALPPSAAPGPPHASQVPREADSLQMLLRRYPVMWQGLLALKNDSAAVQMHFVGGHPRVAAETLPRHTDGSTPPLRIAQRMRLEPAQLDQVHRKMKLENEHCILLALPCGRDHMDVLQQSTNLTHGFITYLQRKQAAGIVNVAPPGHRQAMYTVHIFPSCEFANENLNRFAPDLMHRVADIAHLLIVIATV